MGVGRQMVRRTMLVAAIGLVVMLALAVPHRASACSCCACDFGHGIIECGMGVTDLLGASGWRGAGRGLFGLQSLSVCEANALRG